MNGIDSVRQISAMRRAMRQTNFSDSITHGPRMNVGSFPPRLTFWILRGVRFTGIDLRLNLPRSSSRESAGGPERRRFRQAKSDVHRLHCLPSHAFAEVVDRYHDSHTGLVGRDCYISK